MRFILYLILQLKYFVTKYTQPFVFWREAVQRTSLLLSYEDISLVNNSDVEQMFNFLRTPAGGAWCESDIIVTSCPKWSDLAGILRRISENSDFLLLYCSLKGGDVRNSRGVCLGPGGDLVPEIKFENWCERQINIFDFCSKKMTDDEAGLLYEESGKVLNAKDCDYVAHMFEHNLAFEPRRQVSVFACEDKKCTCGKLLHGRSLTKHLIEAAENFYSQDKLSGTDPFMLKRAAKLAAGNIAIETGAEQRVVVEERAAFASVRAL